MGRFKKLHFSQKQVIGLCGKLMQSQNMLYEGARVGVALSGGVDSWVLIKTLIIRRKIVPFNFELIILHLNPGFSPTNHKPLLNWLNHNQVAAHIEITDIGPKAHSQENIKKSPCFLCAWERRKKLFELCNKYKLSHLAFGHILDDLVTNFFMNLVQNGRVDGLQAKESFFNGKLTVIRPLLAIDKKTIVQAAKKWKLPIWENPCPSANTTKRSYFKHILSTIAPEKRLVKNIFRGIRRWQLDF